MERAFFVQAVLEEKDQRDEHWKGRKWYVSSHATDAEVIATAFKAVVTAEEHETREKFLYKGKAIYGPHLSLDALLGNADQVANRLGSLTAPIWDGPQKERTHVQTERTD